MKTNRQTNLLWGLVLAAVSLILVLHALEAIPENVYDIMARGWPILLVLAGLSIFLRDRVPFGSALALIVSLVLVGGVTALAFSSRAKEERTDYQAEIALPDGKPIVVSEGISLLEVSVETLAADGEVLRALETDRHIAGLFVGSTESRIQTEYTEDAPNARALLRVIEDQPNEFPSLEAIGRGKIRLELPPGLPLDVAFVVDNGQMIFNMSELALERLNITVKHGDALVTLPAYAPLAPNALDQPGQLIVRDGDITVFVPAEVAVRFELNRGSSGIQPQFDAAVYNYLVGDVLEDKNYENASIKLRYIISAPHGRIRIERAE
jgi:hypothetical protein